MIENTISYAVTRAQDRLRELQNQDGSWYGEVEFHPGLSAQFILLHVAMDTVIPQEYALGIERYILRTQHKDGGWLLFPGGTSDVSISILCYLALRFLGHEASEPALTRARQRMAAAGGAAKASQICLLWLHQLGIKNHVTEVGGALARPTLARLLRNLNLSEKSGLSDQVVKFLFADKNQKGSLTADAIREDLKTEIPVVNGQILPKNKLQRIQNRFFTLRSLRKSSESLNWGSLTAASLDTQTLILIALAGFRSLAEKNADVEELNLVMKTAIERVYSCGNLSSSSESEWRIQPVCGTRRATLGAFLSTDVISAGRAKKYLLTIADYSLVEKGMLLRGLAQVVDSPPSATEANSTVKDLIQELLATQKADGGWGDMAGPSVVDITAPIAHGLAAWKNADLRIKSSLGRARHFLLAARVRTTAAAGLWSGNRGTNFIFGTAWATTGLRSIDDRSSQQWSSAPRQFFLNFQNSDGGWGETKETYGDANMAGQGESGVLQTSWALLGLIASAEWDDLEVAKAAEKGIAFLLARQLENGEWLDAHYVGVSAGGFVRHSLDGLFTPLAAIKRVSEFLVPHWEHIRKTMPTEESVSSPNASVK